MRLSCLLLLALELPAIAGATSAPVEIVGNVVMPDEVYLAVLSLAAGRDADAIEATIDDAELLAATLLDFLHNGGYEIAKVEPRVEDGRIILEIDEGRLTKIIFRGLGTMQTLRLKLELSIPHRVYNRPDLTRQLARLKEELDLPAADFDLVPTDDRGHVGPQLTNLGSLHHSLEAIPALPPPGDYELHIKLGRRDWRSGLHLHATYNNADGIEIGTSYRGLDLLFDDDRWMVRGDLGGRTFPSLNGGSGSRRIARAIGELRYDTPAIGATRLRPYAVAYADLMVRQRPDRDIETVDWLRLGVLANLEIEPVEGLRTSLGAGAERRQLDDIVVVGSNPDVPEPFVHNRWVVSMQGDMLLDTQEIRLDQRHELDFELRATFEDFETFLWASRANYQRVFGLGWHDLWVRARGAALWGDVPFIEQEPVTRHLRGVFPDEYYVNGIASASAEFRFSLSRDIFKLSSFADVAVFDHRPQAAARKERRAGISAGVGFHALIVEVVQLNVYAAYGAITDGNRDVGMAASLAKAF